MRGRTVWKLVRLGCALSVVAAILAAPPLPRTAFSAVGYVARSIARLAPAQSPALPRDTTRGDHSRRRYAPRLKLTLRGSHEIPLDEAVVAVTVLDPQTVRAEVNGERSVMLTALALGETIVIVSGTTARSTYAVEVSRPPSHATRASNAAQSDDQRETLSGSYGLSYSPSLSDGPSLLRHSFEFTQELARGRVLRAGGDLFNFFGGGERTLATQPGLGANRLMLGLDSPAGALDVLDSELRVSRLSFNGYTMRGLHLASTRTSALRGAELFAGTARPSLTLFGGGEGRLAGVVAPVFESRTLRLRVGTFLIDPAREAAGQKAGGVLHTDALYSPDERTLAEAEAAYAGGSLSWRVRLDAERGTFGFHGEAFRLDRRSPLISLGAQAGGRRAEALDLRWRPAGSLALSAGYDRTRALPSAGLRRTTLDRSSVYFNARLTLSRSSRVSLNLTQQSLEAPVATNSSVTWRLRTRSAVLRHSLRLGRRWSNEFEARLTSGREPEEGTALSSGLNLREQLRYSWGHSSVTGYFNHQNNTPSLAGLVARNPSLLPEPARASFEADPAGFLLTNRVLFPKLLPGVELPVTRSTEVGLRFQAIIARRFDAFLDARYGTGEVFASERRGLLTDFGVGLRLDAANSLHVSGARAFAFKADSASPSALTVSFVHRFGAQGRGGLRLSELLGLNRARVEGRVFSDLNGDGRDDPDEPGVAGMKVSLDYDREATTDAGGRFSFGAARPGEHVVTLSSEDLGVRLRASTQTEQRVYLAARQTARVGFGVNDFGSVAGRVFNDLSLAGDLSAGDAPGVGGIRVLLRPIGAGGLPALIRVADSSGLYEFRGLPPGRYTLEIDATTFPADFRLSAQSPWTLTVEPLRGAYLDVPLAAQRAVSGVVFFDRDGDGRFDPQRDEPLGGVRVSATHAEATTDRRGFYILRNLPSGRSELRAQLPDGQQSGLRIINLGADPTLLKEQNIALR